jgi:hypothetical protein
MNCRRSHTKYKLFVGNLRDRNDTAGEFALREKERG